MTEREQHYACRRCGSTRWVAASLTGPVEFGGRAIKQCVPCGHYSDDPVSVGARLSQHSDEGVGSSSEAVEGDPTPKSQLQAREGGATAAHRPDPNVEPGTPVDAEGREPVAPDLSRGGGEGSTPSPSTDEFDPYECCGNCGPGLCYVDQMTGENSEGWGWQR